MPFYYTFKMCVTVGVCLGWEDNAPYGPKIHVSA